MNELPDTSPEFWERHYHGVDHAWGTAPNAALVHVVERHLATPGRALDLGCGHGGDALWLAESGWRVTAVDASATAVSRVTEGARERGLEHLVEAVAADITRELPDGPFDLVTAAFVHTSAADDRDRTLGAAARTLVAPGGVLVVIDHASVAPWSWPHEGRFPTPSETLQSLGLGEGWVPIQLEAFERVATGPGGVTAPVVENIVAVRRNLTG